MKPNKYSQAAQELQTIQFSNGFEIPTEINEKEAKLGFFCIGVKAKDSNDGFSKVYNGHLLTAGFNRWNKMKRQIKQGVFKIEFADMFDKIIILHDPTIAPKKEEPKGLSPKQKGKVKELLSEGKELNDIAKDLKVDLVRVEAYAKTL
jgi:hypothetical protein